MDSEIINKSTISQVLDKMFQEWSASKTHILYFGYMMPEEDGLEKICWQV